MKIELSKQFAIYQGEMEAWYIDRVMSCVQRLQRIKVELMPVSRLWSCQNRTSVRQLTSHGLSNLSPICFSHQLNPIWITAFNYFIATQLISCSTWIFAVCMLWGLNAALYFFLLPPSQLPLCIPLPLILIVILVVPGGASPLSIPLHFVPVSLLSAHPPLPLFSRGIVSIIP